MQRGYKTFNNYQNKFLISPKINTCFTPMKLKQNKSKQNHPYAFKSKFQETKTKDKYNTENIERMQTDIIVEGWKTYQNEEETKNINNSDTILQEKYLNSSSIPRKNDNQFLKNKSLAWCQQPEHSNQAGNTKRHKCLKPHRKNYSCEKRKEGITISYENQNEEKQSLHTQFFKIDQCQASHIQILKTHAKHLDSQQFVRQTSYSCQNTAYKKQDDENKNSFQNQLIKYNLFLTPHHGAKKLTTRSQASAPHYCRINTPSNHKVYKKLQQQLIKKNVQENLKINSKSQNCSQNFLICKNNFSNQTKPIGPIHNSNMGKIPFQKYFNRKRNKCRKIKDEKKIVLQKSFIQNNPPIDKIQGTKLYKMRSRVQKDSLICDL